jgi:Uma2 family endonuclease
MDLTSHGAGMITTSPRVKLTFRDYLLIPEDGQRHELIGGEHYVTPAPTSKHQFTVVNLLRVLSTFVRERQLGRVVVSPFDVVFSYEDVVEPDLLYVARERQGVIGEKNAHGAPDLAVEVLSPGSRRRDLVLKRNLYERSGVGEYWIVDPLRQTVQVFRAELAGLRRVAVLSAAAGDTLESPLFPGLSFPVAEIFE